MCIIHPIHRIIEPGTPNTTEAHRALEAYIKERKLKNVRPTKSKRANARKN